MVETLAENSDIEAVGERHLVRESDEYLPEQSGSFLNEDPGFGQPDAVGDHLQADALVVHRHEELQGALQYFLAVGFHGSALLSEVKDTGLF